MPAPDGPMSFSSALRADSFSMTMPVNSSSTSITTSSIGSSRSPVSGSVWKTTRGRLMETSKPSRRMLSISTPSCSSPRPATSIGVLVGGLGDLDGDVGLGLAQQAVADHPALHLVAFAAGQRAVVDRDGHGDGRRVDRLGGQGVGDLHGAEGVGDGGLGEARRWRRCRRPRPPRSAGASGRGRPAPW